MNNLITVFGLCYNEELMLPYFIAHYRKMFHECRIVLWDNESTDKTHEIALANNCEIVTYSTGGKLDDSKYLELKNNYWKSAKTPWVLIADIDEHLYINEDDLRREDFLGFTIVRSEGWNMVSLNPFQTTDITTIDHGVRSESYDKSYLFKRSEIQEINYGPGCHDSNPIGNWNYTIEKYRCLHYKYIEVEYMIKRHKHFASRLSKDNLKKGYGFHYKYPEQRIRKEFEDARKQAIKIL